MNIQQDPRLSELISSCGKQGFSCDRFIEHLGLPRKTDKTASWKQFDDETGQCRNLYRLVLTKSKELRESYGSARELREALFNPSKAELLDVTGNLLSVFGRSIWKASGSLTRIDEHYPRFLNYENSEDLQRIRSCLYHWILHRALQRYTCDSRKLGKPATKWGSGNEKYKARLIKDSASASARWSVAEDSELDSSGEYENGKGIDSEYIFTETRQMHRESISNTADVPVTQSRESPIRRASRSPSRTSHSAKTKRKDTWTPDSSAPPEKTSFKRSGPFEDHESNTKMKIPRLNSSWSATSPPKISTQTAPKSEKSSAVSKIEVNTKRAEAQFLSRSMPPTPVEMASFEGGKDNDSDGDSCVVIETSPKILQRGNMAERSILSPSATPSEIFPRKEYQPAAQPLQFDRNQLTANLLDLLENPKPSFTSLDETIKQVRRIAKANTLETQQSFDDPERYQKVLNSWLECAGAYVEFRRTTGFEGEKGQWIDFFTSLTPDEKKLARSAFIQTRLITSKWQNEPGFKIDQVSPDLAFLVFNMTSWGGMMDVDEMQLLCTDFNERLLAWFN